MRKLEGGGEVEIGGGRGTKERGVSGKGGVRVRKFNREGGIQEGEL